MKGRTLVAWNLRRLRTERGLTQTQLATDAGVDHVHVGALEREIKSATVDFLDKLAAALDVPIADFFEVPTRGEKRPGGLKSGRKPSSK